MALETTKPARQFHRQDSLPTTRPRRVGREPPTRKSLEFWSWVFMRLSGIVLLVLAVGHVLIMHVFGKGVDRVNFAFVALRWQSMFWRTWDWLMLVLALVHGVNGLRVITLDYVRRPGIRIAVQWLWYVTGAVLVALGTIVVFTFDPSRWPGALR
jgi:succinate dehydrogenase / fumarate reductase membrane anchor subunit